MGLTQERPASDAREQSERTVFHALHVVHARLAQVMQAQRARRKASRSKAGPIAGEADAFSTQLKQFDADFRAYGILHESFLAQQSMLRANISKLGVVIEICKDFRAAFASEGVEIEFCLTVRPPSEGGGIVLLVQPHNAELSIYSKQSGIAKAHAKDLVNLKPRLSIQADYSKAEALVSA